MIILVVESLHGTMHRSEYTDPSEEADTEDILKMRPRKLSKGHDGTPEVDKMVPLIPSQLF